MLKRQMRRVDVHRQKCLSYMNRVWRYIWPDVVTDFHGFDPEEEIGKSSCAIIDMVKTVGFEDADQVNVEELFQSHTEALSNENLLELKNELNNEDGESSDVKLVKHLSTKQLTDFVSTSTMPLASQIITMPLGSEVSYQND
jgi:hypothetical protein